MEKYPPDSLFITSITQAEIFYGIALKPVGKRRTALFNAAKKLFFTVFAEKVLPFTDLNAPLYGELMALNRKKGNHPSPLDIQIAAIALAHNATLATRNTKDFKHCGIKLVNPWKSGS
jgi:toxin FitB